MRQVKEKANWKNMFLLGLEPAPQAFHLSEAIATQWTIKQIYLLGTRRVCTALVTNEQ